VGWSGGMWTNGSDGQATSATRRNDVQQGPSRAIMEQRDGASASACGVVLVMQRPGGAPLSPVSFA
jgi:hypothetical protein